MFDLLWAFVNPLTWRLSGGHDGDSGSFHLLQDQARDRESVCRNGPREKEGEIKGCATEELFQGVGVVRSKYADREYLRAGTCMTGGDGSLTSRGTIPNMVLALQSPRPRETKVDILLLCTLGLQPLFCPRPFWPSFSLLSLNKQPGLNRLDE